MPTTLAANTTATHKQTEMNLKQLSSMIASLLGLEATGQ
jgi:hypothetical protein